MNILLDSLAAAAMVAVIAGAGPNPANASEKSAVKIANLTVGESFILVYATLLFP